MISSRGNHSREEIVDDDYQREDLEEISMNYGKSYPRVHPRS